MQIILLCVIVAVGVTVASDQRAPSSEVQSSRTKRIYLSSSQTTTIQSGFDAATHLFDKMDGLQFDGVVGSLIGSTSSFLGAIGPFVGFVLSLFQSPNTLSSQLKAVYTKLDGRFDNVDRQLVALKAQIKFLPAEIQFNQWESNIYSLLTRFELLAAAKNSAGHTSESDSFKKTFHNVYRDAGGQLAGAVINGHLTSGRLFDAFLSKNEYDRKQTQKFMLGTLNLLMRAAYLELTYRQLKHMDVAALRRTWITRFTNIKTQMQNVDKAAVSHYHTQMVTDVDNFATQYQSGGSLSNTAFSSQLYSKLTTKYYWRDWFVLAAHPTSSYSLAVHACEYNQHDKHGRTIAVASVLKTKRHSSGSGYLHHLKLYITSAARPGSHSHYRYTCTDANTEYGKLPASAKTNSCTSTYVAAGVGCMKSTDIHINGASSRLSSSNPHGANLGFLFG